MDLFSVSRNVPTGLAMLVFGTLVYGSYGLLMGANCYLDERNRMRVAGCCR